MDLVWLGHSSFRLHSEGMVVVTDPFPESLGLRMDGRPAGVVTVSNTHPNHSAAAAVAGGPRVFSTPGEYEYNGVMVRGVMTPLVEGAPYEHRNVAYTIELDGVSVCHLGDLSRPLANRQLDDLKPVDVVLMPAGGNCTVSMDHALQVVQDLDPRIVVPMHFGHGQEGVPLDGVEPFLRRLSVDEAQPQARLVVSQGSLPSDLRVNLMSPARG